MTPKEEQKFSGSCLKHDKATYNHGTIVNIYIVFEISKNYNSSYPTLENCLFRAVSLTKNADIEQYRYGMVLDLIEKVSPVLIIVMVEMLLCLVLI